MAELVAIDLPGGPDFVRALLSAWEAGDAVAPLDRRWGAPARRRVLDMLRPARIVTAGGTQWRTAGMEVAEGDALVVTTSGSTGEPKGVVLTHEAVAASAHATSRRLGVDPRRHQWLACLPLSHIGGLSVVTRAVLAGTGLVVHDGFDPARVAEVAGPDVLVSLVPTTLARTDASLFGTVVLGGSSPPRALPPNVVTTYGLTETGSGVVYDGVPLDGVEIDISDQGEIRLRCPMLLRCYRDGTVAVGADGWFATGDAGALDEQGRLQVHGRLSEMIITGGENVWPVAVEEVLRRHPGVAEVAVSSRPDPEWGEIVVACVVPADAKAPPGLAELRSLVRSELAAYAAPKALALMTSLPRTAIGKLRREELRRLVRTV